MIVSKYKKDFQTWNMHKKYLEKTKTKNPFIQEREIWWVSIGVNLGYEEDGKGRSFNRPVLVIKKFSQYLFLGVPLTTNLAVRPYKIEIKAKGSVSSILTSQIKAFSTKRVENKITKIEKEEFEKIVERVFRDLSPLRD